MKISKNLNIGENMKKFRTEKGFSQKELATLLDIPYSTYSNYENGNRTPDQEQLEKIASILEVTTAHLLGHIPIAQSVKLDSDIYLFVEKNKASAREEQQARLLAYVNALSSKHKHLKNDPLSSFSQSEPACDHIISLEDNLLIAFRSLNAVGKKEAVLRIQELAELEKYRLEGRIDSWTNLNQ